MEKLTYLLERELGEQIALEEQLCQTIEQQICEVDYRQFPEARRVLIKAKEVLMEHFTPLNELLDELEQAALEAEKNHSTLSTVALHACSAENSGKMQLSRMLRDDYSDLNLIAMGNTMLHTTALALQHKDLATIALEHLHNITPLVLQIHELVPHVVAQELLSRATHADPSIGSVAWENVQRAWQKI